MLRLATVNLLLAPGDTDPTGGTLEQSHDTLYGIIISGVVALILGYMTYRVNVGKPKESNNENKEPVNREPQPDFRDSEISYLKEELNNSREEAKKESKRLMRLAEDQAIKIAKLREYIVELDHDPDDAYLEDALEPRRPRPR